MAKPIPGRPKRRQFTDEFRREAVQMMLDVLSAPSVAERLGLADPTFFIRPEEDARYPQWTGLGPPLRGGGSTADCRR